MSFLSPWFLLGTLAVAGPIVLHLIRRAARERTPFSSLLFLSPTPPRATRRRRLEHVFLLVLRCLCLVLLAAGFARPFLPAGTPVPAVGQETRRRIVLVDTSASMRRDNLWANARSRAEHFLDDASPSDQVSVMAFDQQLRTVIDFAEWASWAPGQRSAMARARLAGLSPGWMGTRLGSALAGAAEELAAESGQGAHIDRRELILITDLQAGSNLDGLQGNQWPARTHVIVERVGSKTPANAGLEVLEAPSGPIAREGGPTVRVANGGAPECDRFRLGWAAADSGFAGEPIEIYLPAGQSRTLTAPPVPAGVTSGRLRLAGDAVDFDNVSYFAAPEVERLGVTYWGADEAKDPSQLLYYLERVFPSTPRRHVRLTAVGAGVGRSSPGALGEDSLVIVSRPLVAAESVAMLDCLGRGRGVLVVLTDARMGPTLAALCGWPEIQMTERSENYGLLGEIDFSHSLFAPFADPRFSDFTSIHFWKRRQWAPPTNSAARIVARFDDGSPALVELPVERGRLLVLSSSWSPTDSQFALSSKFLPFMQRLLDWGAGAATVRQQYRTGETIASPPHATDEARWQKPDGKLVALAGGVGFSETDQPGIYVARSTGQERSFAVNLPLEESRLVALSAEDLARLGVPVDVSSAGAAAQARLTPPSTNPEELESRQKLWRWLLVAVLAGALAETLLGGWLARRVTTAEVNP